MCLLPDKCMFWKEHNSLILADLHIGKAGHFRKAGIPIPSHIHIDDLVDGHIVSLEKISATENNSTKESDGDLHYEIVNLGQGIGHSTISVAKTIKDIVDKCQNTNLTFDYKTIPTFKNSWQPLKVSPLQNQKRN